MEFKVFNFEMNSINVPGDRTVHVVTRRLHRNSSPLIFVLLRPYCLSHGHFSEISDDERVSDDKYLIVTNLFA